MSGGVENPIIPALVAVGAWTDGVRAGGRGDVSLSLTPAFGAVVLGTNDVAVRGAEAAHDPFVIDGGLELVNPALDFLLFGGGKLSVAPVAASAAAASVAAAVVVASANGWHGGFEFAEEFFISACWVDAVVVISVRAP